MRLSREPIPNPTRHLGSCPPNKVWLGIGRCCAPPSTSPRLSARCALSRLGIPSLTTARSLCSPSPQRDQPPTACIGTRGPTTSSHALARTSIRYRRKAAAWTDAVKAQALFGPCRSRAPQSGEPRLTSPPKNLLSALRPAAQRMIARRPVLQPAGVQRRAVNAGPADTATAERADFPCP